MMFLLTFVVLWISVSGGTDQLKNLALRGRATQSTNYPSYSAAINAIDGNTDPLYTHGSCFSSESQLSPWWRLDLLETHRISHITITNRGDCCAEYINGAEILIGNSLANNGNNNARCATITAIPLADTQNFLCNNMEGRYVNIILNGKVGYLTFCEVQVFGVPVNNPCKN
ncbi:fucolectin-4-like isoform 2-T2 [Anomaloglossus baeobatrachus]